MYAVCYFQYNLICVFNIVLVYFVETCISGVILIVLLMLQVLLDTETQCTQLEDERTETGHTNLEDHDTGIDMDLSRQHNNITSWPTMSSDSLGR